MGMLANGFAKGYNVLSSTSASINEANTQASPGSGAISHYHNYTWFAHRDILPRDELFVNFGPGWFQERGFSLTLSPAQLNKPTLAELRREGYCLDNLQPGVSNIPSAGRGGFASRNLREGSVVAPVPVLPVSLKGLTMYKQHESGQWVQSKQLLLNYCYGHANSTIALCPYSNMINLINHAPTSNNDTSIEPRVEANVRLRWSEESSKYLNFQSMESLQASSTRLLLELIALRDIREGEEILLDYGIEWNNAWTEHVKTWEEHDEDDFTMPSHVLNQRKPPILRAMKEQQSNPYPDNIFTSCYYKLDEQSMQELKSTDDAAIAGQRPTQVVVEWKASENVHENRSLRPCWILDRHPANDQMDGDSYQYTVRLLNRPGQPEKERIPKSIHFIVNKVPREAIQFSDKLYTTAQHSQKAFRHSIRALNGIFPVAWMDLESSKESEL